MLVGRPTHDRLPAQPEPEIATADLTGFALELALLGHPDGAGLALPDPPPAAALPVAPRRPCAALGAVDDGRPDHRARPGASRRVGAHPRLARALLDGAAAGRRAPGRRGRRAAVRGRAGGPGDDLVAALAAAARRRDRAAAARWRAEVRRLRAR